MFPLELNIVVIRFYKRVVAKIKTIEGWSKDIKCNIGVKKGCPLSPTIFGIYIDKLEECLGIARCKGADLTDIIISLLLYVDDIVLLARSHEDLDKQLQTLHDYFSKMGMTVNTNTTKIMIIKSKKISHGNFVYDDNCLEQVSSFKYLGIGIPYHLNWNYKIEKRIISGWKAYYVLENYCKAIDLCIWSKKRFLFETLVTPIVLYGCEVWGCNISEESWRKIEMIQYKFITYNLKIKRNTPYPILLIEAGLSPIESMAMFKYLMYKKKLYNMESKRLPKIAFNFSQNPHLHLKRGWHKDS